ncbi:TPA: type II secretion system inner membrane protein GspF [Escherichia coli]|uniref:type II secretion system inner membrane protein GspF n=1 Tax=Escherichia coli TaxID=562 RepID=UPI001C2C5B39|nr:type II secretion system inner membrane protein GspF [Escherichia coli]MBV0809983.1 type II secretion system inner membrane protein GspF [Escherichia coli]MCV4977487.1 type II secretion system inner membrane protein GspF [Escherichia coli]MCY0006432.1 type II secretion system inner membrane protein GspF [Escherichia coli]HAP3135204.1 type II secretion system inner membrane protein GspF [Escherichia coli]HCD3646171.1 type II secretion system inner membrane protein GspF [Escherichia coli]
MNYRYRAMTQDGQKLQGIIDANDERQARLRLREEGLFLLDIRPQKSSGVKTRRPRISHSELTLFTRQLATLSAAALPLEESLAVIGQQSSNKRLGDVLNQVRSAILEGHPLSDALQHFPTLFDSLYRTLVKAGEKSGLLAPVLEKLADYNENRQKIRSKLIQSLIYPCMLTTVAIGVVIILLTAVVPKITEQFVHMKQQLPLSTRILLGLSDTLQRIGPTLLATVFIVAVGFWLWLKRGNNRHRFHAMLLRVALIGPLICAINSARYLRTLSILQSSGVPLLDGMSLSTESLNNLEIRQRLANAAENVRQGNSIHLSLEQTAIFPPMMLYMVASGEKSGQLGTLMVRAADNQETLQQNRIALTLSIFEPALIITMALIVLFIVVSVLQPLLQLNSMIN